MGERYVAFIRVKVRSGEEYIYALHSKKNIKEGKEQLTEEERQKCLDANFLWN